MTDKNSEGKMMSKNMELRWRNAALKHLIIGPGETAVQAAIESLLTRASGRTKGLLPSDLWAKGTKKKGHSGEVDPELVRFIVTWGGRTVMTIYPHGFIKTVSNEHLERLSGDGTTRPSASSSEASSVFKPLAEEMIRSEAAGAFDQKRVLDKVFKDAPHSETKGIRLRL
ncbi:hypothetical protein ACEPWQ_25740 (plasmid) [Leclercia adecarboxylata]|uniref:hypothetical protein n=1 Tax=Leclercia adecarboxylata TaxID=83655 RepID=UPI0030CEB587